MSERSLAAETRLKITLSYVILHYEGVVTVLALENAYFSRFYGSKKQLPTLILAM